MRGGNESARPDVRLDLAPAEATVGDRLQATLSVLLPSDVTLETGAVGPRLGPFAVEGGRWSEPSPEDGGQRWTWSGELISFRTGEFDLPAVRIEYRREDGSGGSAESAPVPVTIHSVLDSQETLEGALPELADLKAPASLEPDYSGLWTTVILLALLLAVAGCLRWLQRRYAARLARIEMPESPFQRTPPHIWARDALQQLLDRGLEERDQVDLFFMELSRIVKLYLGGRYRLDLLERTSGEVPGVLAQARTPDDAIDRTRRLLALADGVKFAGDWPDPAGCRRAVDAAHGIVDATEPREEPPLEAERGAA